ncbi:hypothetical protein TIFTF001_004938 [Ficus carica]|uniref:Uncharacterized protein n=1 Tax=Ficus carica TaxID=3494 RepID=A0AA87ZHP4_FICCA|nr:hypothetical protein TIFTF001_004938 [Ficus carica]
MFHLQQQHQFIEPKGDFKEPRRCSTTFFSDAIRVKPPPKPCRNPPPTNRQKSPPSVDELYHSTSSSAPLCAALGSSLLTWVCNRRSRSSVLSSSYGAFVLNAATNGPSEDTNSGSSCSA